jgi:hypothetical protein
MLNSVFPDNDQEKLSLGSYNTLRKRGNLPRANQAARIAQHLGVSVEYLVFGTDTKKPDISKVIRKTEELLEELKKI